METAKGTDLPDLLEHLGYTVRRLGSRYHTTREMDSIRIKDRRTWKRYSNGKGGDAITFLQEFCGKDFREAVNYLLEFTGNLSRELFSVADENGGKLKNRVVLFCDEFGTMPPFDVLSRALGRYTVQSGSISRSKGENSQSLQMAERALMTPDELKSIPKGNFVVMKTGSHPMKTRLRLFLDWGITFDEPYQMPEHGQRKVYYAGRQELEQAIQNAFFLAPEKEGPARSHQEGRAGGNGGTAASRKAQDAQQSQPLATIPNFVKKQDGPPPDASGGGDALTYYDDILTVPVGLFLALLVAMLLNAKIKFKGGFRTIFFLPMVCAPAAVTMVWRFIFNGEYGILNQLFGTEIGWITDPNFVMISCAIVAIWSNIGYDAILLLAGLQNIPRTLYEANSIDGAGKVKQFFTITLPMVSPTLFVVMIMRLMASVKVYDLIYMMVEETNPAVTSVQSLMYLFYRESFTAGSRGMGSAIVIWTVLIIGLVTVIQFVGQKKWVNYDV